MGLNISIAAEPIFKVGQFAVTNSLLTSWIIALVLIIFSIWFSLKPLADKPKKNSLQNFLELIVSTLLSLYEQAVGAKKAKRFFPLITTFFIYILLSNWFELLPFVGSLGLWETHQGENILIPFLRAPTSDINTTLAMAVVSVIAIQYYGLKYLGIKYLTKFLDFSSPINFAIGILELVSEVTKIISFAFRLFGNIFAGEVLLIVMSFLLPFIAPLPFLGMEVFVGLIQAFVFAMLTLAFLRLATSKQH